MSKEGCDVLITVYTVPGCPASRKVKSWFKEKGLPYKDQPLFDLLLDKERFAAFLNRHKNELFADEPVREKPYFQNTDKLASFLIRNPSVIPRPVIVMEAEPEQTVSLVRNRFSENFEPVCPESCPSASFCKYVRNNNNPVIIEETSSGGIQK